MSAANGDRQVEQQGDGVAGLDEFGCVPVMASENGGFGTGTDKVEGFHNWKMDTA